MNITNRLKKLRESLGEKGLDGIFISQPQNRYYLSGFNGSAGYLLITQKETILATDFRYYEQAKEQAPDYRLFQIAGPLAGWFPRLVEGLDPKKLGFEAGDVTFNLYKALSEAISKSELSLQLAPTENLVENIRAIKDTYKI